MRTVPEKASGGLGRMADLIDYNVWQPPAAPPHPNKNLNEQMSRELLKNHADLVKQAVQSQKYHALSIQYRASAKINCHMQ